MSISIKSKFLTGEFMIDKTLLFCGNSDKFLDKTLVKHSNKSNGGVAFRIPSIVNAGGVLVAAVDRASCGADWGYIEIAIRRSYDGGRKWTDLEVIAVPPARESEISGDNYSSAFFIDPCMAADDNGNIYMFVDFWPECKGIFSRGILDKKKEAYAHSNNITLPVIYNRDGERFYVAKNGAVINKDGEKTDYVIRDCGYLYQNEQYVGNIFINGSKPSDLNEMGIKTTFGAPLKAPKRCYVYMLKSTDRGETWSKPKDVTGMFLIPKDGTFLGVAPGAGLITSSGRILMPLYRIHRGKTSASVYSDDEGKTWKRNSSSLYSCNKDEWQMVEIEDNVILGFGRQTKFGKTPVSISYNSGKNWTEEAKTDLFAPKCQKSFLMVGKDCILCSHPSGKKRENGVISVGKVEFGEDKRFTGIKWKKDTKINEGFFAYSCLVRIDNSTIGVMYESQPGSYIEFKRFSISELI